MHGQARRLERDGGGIARCLACCANGMWDGVACGSGRRISDRASGQYSGGSGMRHLSTLQGSRVIEALEALPDQIESVLKLSDQIRSIAKKYVEADGVLFFGRQFNFPVALEGALKMKEITYLFAEGHPSAELKHGIIALVRPDWLW